MTPEQLERAIAGVRSVFQTTGHEGVAALAIAAGMAKVEGSDTFDGVTFDFNQSFPVDLIRAPVRGVNELAVDRFSFEDLEPFFEQIKEDVEAGRPVRSLELPEGVHPSILEEKWDQLRLFFDSGAVLRQNTEHNIEVASLRLNEHGIADVLVVLDEDFRVISGLPYVWALAEDDSHKVAAVILHGAPQDAGWLHTHAEALKWGQTLWEKGEIQGVLESSTPAEREFFQGFGFHQVPEVTVLSLSWDTFDRLAGLITKQLGGNTRHDPAQLLFVEALREAVLTTRERIIREGKGKPGDPEKLERHLRTEAELTARGERIESENEWEWSEDESGLWSHPASPKYRFKIVESQPSASHDQRPQVDPFFMSLSQFQLLARDHFGITGDQAAQLYESESAESFNSRLRRYVGAVEPIERRGPNGPSDAERVEQAERLALWNSR